MGFEKMPGISGSAVFEKRNNTCFQESSSSSSSSYLQYPSLDLCIQLVPSCSYHSYPSGLPWCYPCLGVGAHQRLFLWWTLQQLHAHHNFTHPSTLQVAQLSGRSAWFWPKMPGFNKFMQRWNQRNLCATRYSDSSNYPWSTIIMRYNIICMTFHVPTETVVSIRDVTINKL